jgi:hypothetical protein
MLVALVATVHGERGAATIEALLEILARSAPSIIFAEIPRSHIDRHADGLHGTLESRAVARYSMLHEVEVDPVDAPAPGNEFFANEERMWRRIERTSPEYRRLTDLHIASVHAGGFEYLCSQLCLETWDGIYREAAETVSWICDARLNALFERWRRVTAHRDNTMLSAILEHGERTGGPQGMLLVGTSHRRSLIEKVAALNHGDPQQLQWDLTSFLAPA